MHLKDIVNTPGSTEIVQVQATTFIVKVFFALDYYPWEFYQSQHFTHQVEKNNGNQYVSVATVPKVKKKHLANLIGGTPAASPSKAETFKWGGLTLI